MNLFDTGIIIEMIKQKQFTPGAISPLTLIEVLRGIDEKKRHKVKHLLEESFSVLNLDNNIIETYCNLYNTLKKEGTLIPDADLLIAATAIAHNLTLQTNDQHYQRLKPHRLQLQ